MTATGLAVLTQTVRVVELVLCLTVLAVLGRRWRAGATSGTRVAAALFALLSVLVASGWYTPADTASGVGLVWVKALVVLLLALPYLLVLLAAVLGAVSRRAHQASAAAYALLVAVTLAAPPLPGPEQTRRPAWVVVYSVAALAVWSAQSLLVAVGLWRAGRASSSVVRHRMRSLATGAVVVAASLVVGNAAGSSPPRAVQAVLLLAGLGSIALFALAFLLPPVLRVVWRQGDLAVLAEAERGLMTALTRAEVGATIVPVLGTVFGGTAALLDADADADADGAAAGADATPDVRALAAVLPPHAVAPPGVSQPAPGVLAARLDIGWLVARGGRLAPVFGDDDAALLGRVATLVDLALQRVRLHEQETASRRAAEAATGELETLLYSVSHDLRSPLISVLGYLDFLRAEHGPSLAGDGPHYLERITVNALYMQSLISDLLELSRIGRADPPPEDVDLRAVAEQVADGARLRHPRAVVDVVAPLPVVRLPDVRARQLLTNLVDNALTHGGRDDVRVTVRAGSADDGGCVLEVADDGRGVPEEYRSRVLRVFERLDAPKTSPGTGMGLAICKRIVESAGGSVVVDGPPPGAASGTTVRLLLPARLVVSPGDARPAPAASGPVVLPGQRPAPGVPEPTHRPIALEDSR